MNPTLIVDIFSGKKVYKTYRQYSETQWFGEEEMRCYQLNKLSSLLSHCYHNVPYYRTEMNRIGLEPDDVSSLEVLSVFPILTKEDIKSNYEDFVPRNIDKIRGYKAGFTGGTTGGALKKMNDAATRSSTWGAYMRFYDWMGIGKKDRILNLMGGYGRNRAHLGKWLIKKGLDYLNNSISIDTYDPMDINLMLIERILDKQSISLIRGYTQYMYSIAMELQKKGKHYKLKAVMTTAEPLFPEHRDLFRDVFGCETFDQYGCGEIGGVAFECDHHNGLHVTEERVILETNERNELLITDLDNFAMPLIRYWNGDEAEISKDLCTCGRKSKLIRQIRGRVVDYLYGENGSKLHSSYLWKALYESGIAQRRNLIKFQMLQKDKSLLTLRYVGDQFDQIDMVTFRDLMIDKLGPIKVEFIKEHDIENASSGKFRPVIGLDSIYKG